MNILHIFKNKHMHYSLAFTNEIADQEIIFSVISNS